MKVMKTAKVSHTIDICIPTLNISYEILLIGIYNINTQRYNKNYIISNVQHTIL
jgi:hypothetical protein